MKKRNGRSRSAGKGADASVECVDVYFDQEDDISVTEGEPLLGDSIATFSFCDEAAAGTKDKAADAKLKFMEPAATAQGKEKISEADAKFPPTADSPMLFAAEHANSQMLFAAAPANQPVLFDTASSSSAVITEPALRGMTPPIDGEYFTIKRCYQYRPSTIRKLNEIKARHADINVYLNTILDEAINHYYELIVKGGGAS